MSANYDYIIVGAGSAGLRAGRAPDRGPGDQSAGPRVRRQRPQHLHPDALGVLDPDERSQVQLALPHRAGAGPRRPHASTARAARSWAARPRSTASSTCAAMRTTSTSGRRSAPAAGAIATACPTSASPRPSPPAATNIAAATVRCTSPAATTWRTRSTAPSSRPATRQATARPTIRTATCRRASARCT